MARRAAERLGFIHLNSGALYRGVALTALRSGVPLDDEAAVAAQAAQAEMRFERGGAFTLNGEDIRAEIYSSAVSKAVAKTAAHPSVRAAMTALQRRIASEGDAVVEGRDVTTVVFPHAQAKFYLDASIEERARRRLKELLDAGEDASQEEIERDIRERDRKDKTRAHSPLLIAEDARVIDTTEMTLEQVVDEVARVVESVIESVKKANVRNAQGG